MSANQEPSDEDIREFVIAGHGNLTKVKEMLAARPILLNLSYPWQPDDRESALQGAAHVGSRPVVEFLLAKGAPLDICTAAMLGRRNDVEAFLQKEPDQIKAHGAHGIPLLTHAALSGDVALVEMLNKRGANTGTSLALSLAVNKGDVDMTRWLLENGSPDLAWKNFQGKTAFEVANENGNSEIAELLISHGALP
jgi:ankyrin repeat protein